MLPLRFEDFSLDPDRRELRRAGDLVAVEPQVFDLIDYLVRNRERGVGHPLIVATPTDSFRASPARGHKRIFTNSTARPFLPFAPPAIGANPRTRRKPENAALVSRVRSDFTVPG